MNKTREIQTHFGVTPAQLARMSESRRQDYDTAAARVGNVDYMAYAIDRHDEVEWTKPVTDYDRHGIDQFIHLGGATSDLGSLYADARRIQRTGDKRAMKKTMLGLLKTERKFYGSHKRQSK